MYVIRIITDEENDLIAISTDEEFQEAKKSISDDTLRIFIQRLEGKNKSH
jgi:hypothetical protein